jgi:hypothetical protein
VLHLPLQTGYYDIAAKRYVLVWVATAPEQDAEPLLFIAVSETSDPTGQWSVKALTIKPSAATFKCTGGGLGSQEPFFVNYPQVQSVLQYCPMVGILFSTVFPAKPFPCWLGSTIG